jgi:hypothetical protein
VMYRQGEFTSAWYVEDMPGTTSRRLVAAAAADWPRGDELATAAQ